MDRHITSAHKERERERGDECKRTCVEVTGVCPSQPCLLRPSVIWGRNWCCQTHSEGHTLLPLSIHPQGLRQERFRRRIHCFRHQLRRTEESARWKWRGQRKQCQAHTGRERKRKRTNEAGYWADRGLRGGSREIWRGRVNVSDRERDGGDIYWRREREKERLCNFTGNKADEDDFMLLCSGTCHII